MEIPETAKNKIAIIYICIPKNISRFYKHLFPEQIQENIPLDMREFIEINLVARLHLGTQNGLWFTQGPQNIPNKQAERVFYLPDSLITSVCITGMQSSAELNQYGFHIPSEKLVDATQ